MSLIYEALKKLEREKRAPDRGFLVVAQESWPERRSRRGWYVLGGVVLLAGGALLGRSLSPPAPASPTSSTSGATLPNPPAPATGPADAAAAAAPAREGVEANPADGQPAQSPVANPASGAPARPEPAPTPATSPLRPTPLPATPRSAAGALVGGSSSQADAPSVPPTAPAAAPLARPTPLPPPAAVPEVAGVAPAPPVTAPARPSPRLPALQAISEQQGEPVAILDGRLVRVGEEWDGIRVVRIGAAEVEVEIGGVTHVLGFE